MNALLRSWVPAVAALGLLACGCNDDKTTVVDAGALDAGPPKPVLDGKLGEAVAAAESSARAPSANAKSGDGPPESGIFAPGLGDKAHAAGAPASVDVLNEGADPKIQLALSPASETTVVVTSGVRIAQQPATPSFDFTLAVKIDKPKDKGEKKDDKKDEKAGPLAMVARVAGVGIAGAQLPKEVADQLAKLKGSELKFQVSPEGAITEQSYTVAKDADPGLEVAVRALSESFGLLVAPLPLKPVGVGGYWMATDRATSFGIEVVRYRVYKVQRIEAGKATLSVDVRQYAVKDEVDLNLIAKGQKMNADRFDSQGKGTVQWASGAVVAPGSDLSQRVLVVFGGAKNGPGKQLPLELGTRSSEPDKSDKKK